MSAPVLAPARAPRAEPLDQRLMVVDARTGTLRDGHVRELAQLLRRGDVLVLNDSGTLPASLSGRVDGREVELRLAGELGPGRFRALLFGEGTWRDDTDDRPPPPQLAPGASIALGHGLRAHVIEVDTRSHRLLEVRMEPSGDAFWRALYAIGRPIQYRYLAREMTLAELSTPFAARPWSVELPSAGRTLTQALLREMRDAGVEVHALTHAAGPSATGDPSLDAILPLPERYEIPAATARAVMRAKTEGRSVVAVGTTVTRALEGSFARHGEVRAGLGETDLRIGPTTPRHVVDALLTGAHDPSSSHYALLGAFAPAGLLTHAIAASARLGYLAHELGDGWLVIGGEAAKPPAR